MTGASSSFESALRRMITANGVPLSDVVGQGQSLIVFLRHFGCTFCREALSDLSQARPKLEALGIRMVLVHMSTTAEALEFFAGYGLEKCELVSDPARQLYSAFGLERARAKQFIGPKVWLRGFQAGVLDGHGIGWLAGDGLQMPGVFLLKDGALASEFRHQTPADRPDYVRMAKGECVGADCAPLAEPTGSVSP